MATNNNNEDEPRIIALERQVKTLAAAVEHLTKQNHDPEEQLRQRDVGPNSHEEEQEGIGVKRRDRERLEGSHAPSKQEQQDTNRPFVTNTASPHMVTEM